MTGPAFPALTLAAGLLIGVQAQAAPCVGANFQRPLPGATGVETRFVDVPSPRFPGLWQEGRIEGHPYVIYANGEASLQEGRAEPRWSIFVLCDLDAGSCTQTAEGSPPAPAVTIATMLGQCFVAPEQVVAAPVRAPDRVVIAPPSDGWALTPPPDPVFAPQDPGALAEAAGSLGAANAAAVEPTAPCGLQTVPEGEPGITLQLLLVEAGVDPGPIDGFPGRRTRAALAEVLGAEAARMEIAAATTALSEHLCAMAKGRAPGAEE
ncbi:peptidoglycan-binding domain-containing protein [Pseudooceanicola aestuarii]|uniref:peptidoglycan-binding domain-containing protein n=1 Tax=Pseudooceanicola aestuarii TaxID=2697319 RepID=UPI0013D3CA35|nr:hypothetical protein [Pseudooceanicola aestuarii]